jgi:Raf kinase inhibitor-like YbhB/YbcL family protein
MPDPVPAWLAACFDTPRAGHGLLAVARLGDAALLNKDGFRLTSAAFADGEALDPSFTADEEDSVAPPLEWTAPPRGSEELVLVVEDADTPGKATACHWLVWGLAAQRGKLMEGEVPPRVGKNAQRNSEWLLPEPPHGDVAHDYVFQLFALDLPLVLMPGASRDDLLKAMAGHVTAVALLTGTYARVEDGEDGDE